MSDRGGHPKRITKEKREEILRVFEETGLDAAQAIATRLKLAKDYVKRLAAQRGIT